MTAACLNSVRAAGKAAGSAGAVVCGAGWPVERAGGGSWMGGEPVVTDFDLTGCTISTFGIPLEKSHAPAKERQSG